MRGDNFLIVLSIKIIGLLAFSLLLIFVVTDVSAAPAAPIVVTLTQPDGSKFEAVAWGDEWFNGMETIDGYTIIFEPNRETWVYARENQEDRLALPLEISNELVVGKDDPTGLPKHLRPQDKQGISYASPLPRSERSVIPNNTNIGTQPILVLLVDYENTPGQTSPDEWHQKIFGETNSVGHYYFDASFGNLTFVPALESSVTPNDGVVGWLTLGKVHPNTARNISEKNLDIVQKAILASDSEVNYSSYDINQDGFLSFDELHIMVIVAGNDYAYGGAATCAPSVYAHQYYLDYIYVNAPVVDGVKVASYDGGGGYTQFGEFHCEIDAEPAHTATIGIIAHELGHDLQWPDLYDTFNQYSIDEMDTQGIGNWGLMGTGIWNRSDPSAYYGDSPAYPTAWSRWYQGWFTPIHITESLLGVTIPPVATSGIVYQLRNNPNGVDWVWNERSGIGEYFLVENRQPIGYDVGLPGFGLLIWHIDESVIFNNYANSDQDHRLVDLIQADGLRELNLTSDNRGDSGDPFPGATLNTQFNATTNPSSTLYSGIPGGVSVNAIQAAEGGFTTNFFVSSFLDVLPNDWFWNPIESIFASGITNGCEVGRFCPRLGTSRAELAVFIGRAIYGTVDPPIDEEGAEGSIDREGETDSLLFDDLSAVPWAAGWIELLHKDGLIRGVSVDPPLFDPQTVLTRDQMAVVLVRYLYGDETQLPESQGIFMDVDKDHWAAKAIEYLYAQGITNGCEDSPALLYCPDETVSRAEMAAFLNRTFDLPSP